MRDRLSQIDLQAIKQLEGAEMRTDHVQEKYELQK